MENSFAITQAKSFEDRMMDMMRENVGNLFTQEDLKKIAEKGIEKLFFQRRIIRMNYGRDEEKPSLSEELVEKYLKEEMRLAIQEWIKNNPEKIIPIIETAINKGISQHIFDAFQNYFSLAFFQFGESLKQQINSEKHF